MSQPWTTVDPTSTAATRRARVTDCARWLAEHPAPELPLPRAHPPATGAQDAGWRVRIALLDGGVDRRHPDLVGARITTWDGVRGSAAAPVDPRSTAYASLLVGQGSQDVRGLAPAAQLLVAPVVGVAHQRGDELVARAVRWAVAEGAHVIVLPFGRRRLGRRLAVTLRHATSAGAVVFAAAGDRGPAVADFPGSVTGVVAVTAYDEGGLLPRCSALADLAAPGRGVPVSGPAGAHRLDGSGVASVVAAGAHAAGRSELTLELFSAVHGFGALREVSAEERPEPGTTSG